MSRLRIALFVFLLLPSSAIAGSSPAGSAFTYQGKLYDSGNPINNSADVRCRLWDAVSDGTQIGSLVTVNNITISDGIFSLDLDFGPGTFNGNARWLEIAVRVPHDPGDTQPYVTLSPRQPLRPAPYALFALGMDSAALPAGGAWTLTSNLNIDNVTLYVDQASNKIGIGRIPTTNKLEVEGTASKSSSGSWSANSDRRIKSNIETVGGALNVLNRVRLVSFQYTPQYLSVHPVIDDHIYYNVIAQEFAEVFPDYVASSGERLPNGGDEILQVDIHPLIIYSAAAIQELNDKHEADVQQLQSKLTTVENENASMRNRLRILEDTVLRLESKVSRISRE